MIQIQRGIQIFSQYLAAFVKHCYPSLTAGREVLAHTTEQPQLLLWSWTTTDHRSLDLCKTGKAHTHFILAASSDTSAKPRPHPKQVKNIIIGLFSEYAH